MGRSIVYKIDTLPLVASRVEPTLLLVLGSVLIALLLAVVLATLAVRYHGGLTDQIIRLVSTAGLGFPRSGWGSC